MPVRMRCWLSGHRLGTPSFEGEVAYCRRGCGTLFVAALSVGNGHWEDYGTSLMSYDAWVPESDSLDWQRTTKAAETARDTALLTLRRGSQ